MSELLDPMHRALLERLGLRLGWRCLEIGCGNGSISQWLASKVGLKGHVTATDLDLRYIDNLRAPNLEVRQLDILKDSVEPGAYDLVTARAVLHPVKSPKKAVQHMVRFLKPNGVLLSIEPDFLPATAATPEPLRAFWQAWLQWSASVASTTSSDAGCPRSSLHPDSTTSAPKARLLFIPDNHPGQSIGSKLLRSSAPG
jgi:ubiquinone/menaquinone biosynthesis C-methylase UbiE